jgi:hypothetical protein
MSKMIMKLKTDLEREKSRNANSLATQNSASSLTIMNNLSNQPLFVRAHTSIQSFKDKDLLKENLMFPLINPPASKYSDFDLSKTNSGAKSFLIAPCMLNGFMFTKSDVERNKKCLASAKSRGNLSDETIQVNK